MYLVSLSLSFVGSSFQELADLYTRFCLFLPLYDPIDIGKSCPAYQYVYKRRT